MAILDPSTNEIVIRVVYDGAPESGKTTSLRALAGSLAQTSLTPEEDATGRTLWFDWMEYVGGRFEGSRIRCQIVSVPGQREFDVRRRTLLADADVVVSVVDTSAGAFARSLEYVTELRDRVGTSSIGIVLQANKRDVPDAIPIREVREKLGGPTVGFVESVASDGTGIREAFVYAVRLALDRVRDLMNRGQLVNGTPRGAAELLSELRGVRGIGAAITDLAAPLVPRIATDAGSLAARILEGVIDQEEKATKRTGSAKPNRMPRAPNRSVPSGAIWPPVEGRAIMSEVADLNSSPHQFGNGDWVIGLGSGWRVVSRRDAVFSTLDEGRAALIQWARLHAASGTVLSSRRCIVLSESGDDGSWRLWQVVRVEESLRENMARALDEATPEHAIERLFEASKLLLDTVTRVAASPLDLPCTLDSVGIADGGAVYIGLMPQAVPEQPRQIVAPQTLLRSQLEPIVAYARIGDRGAALAQVIECVQRPITDRDGIMNMLVSLFA
ncbi:MAG TPA: GTPase domain-containing protein [Kofleriaceae bacterium]